MAEFDKIPSVPDTDKIFYSKLLVFSIGNFIVWKYVDYNHC